ncbi:cytochrome P450 [Kutzneria sp. NPDC052558]|uniref:cytochrome P450 n=1 Tax=Kutzneria sp. NPDC052558 TaxID=3364121 RepID=UPI0037C75EA5
MREAAYIPWADMDPALRAMMVYEQNDAFSVAQPQPILDRLRRESPVVRWEAGIGFFAMDDIMAACRNRSIVSNHPDTGRPFGMGSREPLIPLHLDGLDHRRYRRLLEPLLSSAKVSPMEQEIRKLADELIDGFAADGQAELFSAFCAPLPATLFLNLFGLPLQDMTFLTEMKDRILENEGADLAQREEIGIEAGDRMRARLHERLAERRREPHARDDLIGRFMTFEVDGERLTDEEIVNILHLFTIAALDTVTSALSCMFAWFAANPEQRRQVVADPSTLPGAIDELMRLETPVTAGGPRWASEDTEVNGIPVKRGELVFLCWGSGNLDPSAFEDPLEPKLDRKISRHLGYAAGAHHCLGIHLARLEMLVAVDQFHRRIPDYHITPGEQPVFRLAGVRQARHLPITFA